MASFTEYREEIRHDKEVEIKLNCANCGNNWILKGLLHQDSPTLSLACLKVKFYLSKRTASNGFSYYSVTLE